jgi:hypothetical protein
MIVSGGKRENKMIKSICSVVIALAAVFSGCGSKSEDYSQVNKKNAAAEADWQPGSAGFPLHTLDDPDYQYKGTLGDIYRDVDGDGIKDKIYCSVYADSSQRKKYSTFFSKGKGDGVYDEPVLLQESYERPKDKRIAVLD